MSTDALDHEHEHHDVASKVIFGFWVYILSDFIVFATLFATYAVLHNNTYGGIGIKGVATLPFVLVQTLVFLTSVFAYGKAHAALKRQAISNVMLWMTTTFLLGGIFLWMGLHQCAYLLNSGHSWHDSAFLSSYFTLIGLQGAHVIAGLLWIVILMLQLPKQGVSETMKIRFTCLGIFWNFLSIIWLFIFAIVYLMGAI